MEDTYPLGLAAIPDGIVELVEHRLQRILESGAPINSAASRRRRTSRVHPIHTVRADQGVQALRCLFNSLVESFARAVAPLTEDFILSQEHAMDATHQTAALAVQVRIDFLLEGSLV